MTQARVSEPYLVERRRQHWLLLALLILLAIAAFPARNTRFLLSGSGEGEGASPAAFAAIEQEAETAVSRFVRPSRLPFAVAPRRARLAPRSPTLGIGGPLAEPPGAVPELSESAETTPGTTDVPGIVSDDTELAFLDPAAIPGLIQGEELDEPGPGPGPVPEPATWAMLVFGFGMLGWAVRRERGRKGRFSQA